MRKTLISAAVLASGAFMLPAMAQVNTDAVDADQASSPAATGDAGSVDALDDSASSAAVVDDASDTEDTTTTGSSSSGTIPSGFPDTGGGGLSK